jgi:hypothetical protein
VSLRFDCNLEGGVSLLENTVVLHGRVILNFPLLGLIHDVVVLFLVEVHFSFKVSSAVDNLFEASRSFLEIIILAFQIVNLVVLLVNFVFELVLTVDEISDLLVISFVVLSSLLVLDLPFSALFLLHS